MNWHDVCFISGTPNTAEARMLGFLTPVGNEAAAPLANAVAAEAFWRMLPRDDPIAAQKAVCAALADPVVRGGPSVDRLRGLLALDQRARSLVDALLVNCVAVNPNAQSLAPQSFQAAFELCRSFGRAHAQVLRSMGGSPGIQGWREYLPYVVLRLFQHRQIELLLRPFVDEQSTWFPWKELHEAYRFAQSRELLHHELPINRCHSPSVSETTLEREYIHVLLQALMIGGHFPPHDAFWVSRSIPRWSGAVALRSHQAGSEEHRFVVDLDGDKALTRSNRELPGTWLCLEMAPVLESIRGEVASLRDAPGRPREGSSLERGRQLKLLRKIDMLCAPERPVIARRGERRPVAVTVTVAVGMAQILRELRDEAEDNAVAVPRTVATGEEVSNTARGGVAEVPTGAHGSDGSTVTQESPGPVNAELPPMTMVDRSDSGCRLHGPTPGGISIIPGTLIAFRDGAASPWTLAVVRRFKKRLAGKLVEIGVEYLGKDPRRIILVQDPAASHARSPGSEPPRFAALYLPESASHPVLPIKTLVLPARGLAPEDRLSLRSHMGLYTIQLKEPLEDQADFVWSPFVILDLSQKDESASAEASSTGP